MSGAPAAKKGLVALFKQGWHEIPEVVGAQILGIVGLGITAGGLYIYYAGDKDNRRYRERYTVYRHDDPRVPRIRKD